MVFCVYHSFFQLASFYRIELFQPCIKAFPYRHFCFQMSVFSLFRSKVTELLFQKEKLVAVCQANFSRNHAGDFFFLRKKRLFDFFLGIDIQQLQLFSDAPLVLLRKTSGDNDPDIKQAVRYLLYCIPGSRRIAAYHENLRGIAVHTCLHVLPDNHIG